MTEIAPAETLLEGRWITAGGAVQADEVAVRIERLIADYLKFRAAHDGGWSKLFRDPADGRYWELTFPSSHVHGGGPPRLENISDAAAHSRYGVNEA